MAKKQNERKAEQKPIDRVTPAAGEATYDEVKKDNKLYFNIVKRRYIWFAISLMFLIPGIISLFMQGLNLGIDFKGGSMFEITFNEPVSQSQVSKALDSVGLTGQVQLSEGSTDVLIRTDALDDEKRDALLSALETEVGEFDKNNLKEDKVGPAIGAELKSGAIKALVVASILILLYIAFRFRFIFAFAGVVALLHDIFVTLGIFSIFQWEIDAPFIAAILTVFGYSINDTVVIFDRIRENEKKLKKRDSFEDMVDKSVWQTMGRSIKTSVTVLIALLAIFILGGDSTRIFSLAMIIGVFSGTYSSIFIASQLVVEIRSRFGRPGRKDKVAEA
ncbi:MAG TPA: protein translocase subunit SecF [Peptococcaceae bacterium]|nr:protein translocase subunit SecF [Peptococcaceae bacterium]